MSVNDRRSAFTLIEVLIVVIIMALLAATIIPDFLTTTRDAKKSSLEFNLHTIRSQIEMYKVHHNGNPPSFTNFVDQMTKPTDINGSTTGAATNLIYGPYLKGKMPINPFTKTNTLVKVAPQGAEPTSVVIGGYGWQYDESNGGFYPNNTEFYTPTP